MASIDYIGARDGRIHQRASLLLPKVWVGWLKGAIFRHGIGKIEEDGHQIPGIFFLKGAKIADEPDYL